VIPEPVAAIAAEIGLTIQQRKDWRAENTVEVHTRFEMKLQELEQKAAADDDLRLQFEILRFRAAYAIGLPIPGTPERGKLSDLIARLSEAVLTPEQRLLPVAPTPDAQSSESWAPPHRREPDLMPPAPIPAPKPDRASAPDPRPQAEPVARVEKEALPGSIIAEHCRRTDEQMLESLKTGEPWGYQSNGID